MAVGRCGLRIGDMEATIEASGAMRGKGGGDELFEIEPEGYWFDHDDDPSRAELMELARRRNHVRIANLTAKELTELLATGRHALPRPKFIRVIHSSRGVDPSLLFTPVGSDGRYGHRAYKVAGGYRVQGVDIEGMFNAKFTPDTVYSRIEDDDGIFEIGTEGYWFVPETDYANFEKFIDSLKPLFQPNSLFDIAAHVVNSKRLPDWLPKSLVASLKERRVFF